MSGKFRLAVSADLFRRAMLGVTTNEARDYLNGVHASSSPEGGAVLAATDGHMLIAIRDPNAIVVGEGIVSVDANLRRLLTSRAGSLLHERLLVVEGDLKGSAYVVDVPRAPANSEGSASPYEVALEAIVAPDERVKGAQFGTALIDGSFPDWRKIVPAALAHDGPVGPFNQRLLQRAAEALCPEKALQTVVVTPSAEGRAAPMLVTRAGSFGPDGFAIVMPLRDESKGVAALTWVRRATTAEAA